MKSSDNFATEGLSGSYKQVVFSQRFGETIVRKRPKRKATRSAAQKAVAATFTEAATYAKNILQDASIKQAYELKAKPGQSAFNCAISDFFKAPVIGDIDTTGYSGQTGSTVIAKVTDDFKVASVTVRIEKQDGTLIEQGDASMLPDGLRYMFVSTVPNGSLAGTNITFTATDLPGHSITKTKIL